MKRALLFVAMLPMIALAGKTEREYMKNEVMPALRTAEETFKSSCGCPLKISLDEATINEEKGMYEAKHVGEGVTSGAPGYCSDDASKKAVCQMKTLKIMKAKPTEFKWDGKSEGTAVTDGNSYVSFDMMTAKLDK